MVTKLEAFNSIQIKNLPQVKTGDIVKVFQKFKEGGKEKIQAFEGVIIAKKHGKGINATITVRRVIAGVGTEKIFPLHSPNIEKIEVISGSKVRRSKLYFLRDIKGKKAKLKRKELRIAIPEEVAEEENLSPEVSEIENK